MCNTWIIWISEGEEREQNRRIFELGLSMSKGKRRWMSQLKQRQQIHLSPPVCSIQGLKELDDTLPH